MKKIISLMLVLVMLASACALAAKGSVTLDDIVVPDVSFPSDDKKDPVRPEEDEDDIPDVDFPSDSDEGSGTVSSTQKDSGTASKDTAAAGMLGMADVFSALKEEEITAYEAVEKLAADEITIGEDFGIILHVLDEEMPLYAMLQEIALFVQDAPISDYLGEEFCAGASLILGEETDLATLVLDELYQLDVQGYDPAYGDIRAAFEFVTVYPAESMLLAFAAVLPAEDAEAPAVEESEADEEEAMLCLPLAAASVDGKVEIQLTQQLLEIANAGENTVAFGLLRVEAPVAEEIQ